MLHFLFVLALCHVLSPTASAAILSTSPTVPATNAKNNVALTTSPPNIPFNVELLKRDQNPINVCGYYAGGDNTVSCIDHDAYCLGTILPNSHAYAICSTRNAATVSFVTTGYSNWTKRCPSSAMCCAGTKMPYVAETLYIAGHYTVTDFNCNSNDKTITLVPDINVINSEGFSRSLAQLNSKSTSASKQSTHKSDSSHLSLGAVIGIGVAVGLFCGVVVVAGAALLFWRRRKHSSRDSNAKHQDNSSVFENHTSSSKAASSHDDRYCIEGSSISQLPTHGAAKFEMDATPGPTEAAGTEPKELQASTHELRR